MGLGAPGEPSGTSRGFHSPDSEVFACLLFVHHWLPLGLYVHSPGIYLSRIFYMPGAVLRAGGKSENEIGKISNYAELTLEIMDK